MADEYPDNELEAPAEEPGGEQAEVSFEVEEVEEGPATAARALSLEGEAAAEGADEVTAALASIHRTVSAALEAQVTRDGTEAFAAAEDVFEGAGNVVGVGLGHADEQSLLPSSEPAAPALNLYVVDPISEERAREVLVERIGAEAAADERVPINIWVTGQIEAQPHRFRIRPSPGGVSVGHARITAGTLGSLARGLQPPRTTRRLILSNNHVLANSNAAAFGDAIVQPGPADGGSAPRDQIAILERFVPIDFSGAPNLVDCATGWAWPDRVRVGQVFVRGGQRGIFRTGSTPVPCRQQLLVGKSGRTTQLTQGRIVDCNATINVRFGARTALFRDQISVRGINGLFSAGGDSGSLIWTWDGTRAPVGLLFAGGGGFTFANKIQHVLRALDIRLET